MADAKAKTYNHDIAGLVRRLDRFSFELHKSVSSSTSKMNEFDQVRLQSYMDAVKVYVGWMVAQPQLDLPESHPREYALDAELQLGDVENEDTNDLIRMISLARAELINSQSSRDPAGFNKFDHSRFLALIEKCEAFLSNYIKVATPIDLPESSPQSVMSGGGRAGV